MEYTQKKGLSISKFTLGTVQLGLDYGIANKKGKPDTEKSFNILETAGQKGINSFDTAPNYGNAEETLGDFFAQKAPRIGQNLITTKLDMNPGMDDSDRDIEKKIRDCIENSIRKLRLQRLPLLLLHQPSDMSNHGRVLLATLHAMKTEGLVEKIGVSIYTADDAERMLAEDLYEVTQVPMNIFDQRLGKKGILKRFRERDMIVFVRSVFLQGLFFIQPENLIPKLKGFETPLRQLADLADTEGLSISQLALTYIRDLESVTSLVIGAETPEQVIDNVGLFDAPRLGEETCDRIGRMFQDIPEPLLDPRVWNRMQ